MEKEKIKLTAIFDNEIFEKHISPFGRDIYLHDFPDFTEKELVVRDRSRNKEEVLESIYGSGKNIIVKLNSILEKLVFKPYGTHKNLGGLLYHCIDTSINGSNGLFIDIILKGLNEIWIGMDKSLFESPHQIGNEAKTLIDEKIPNEK